MLIEIRSEMDSRCLLYPMIRALLPFGRVLIVTSNRYVERLQQTSEESGFGSVSVIYEPGKNFEDLVKDFELGTLKADGTVELDTTYDYVIIDNVPAKKSDMLYVLVNRHQSDSFMFELETIIDKDIQVVICGDGLQPKKQSTSLFGKKSNDDSNEPEEGSELDQVVGSLSARKKDRMANYDPAQKWLGGKTKKEIMFDKLLSKDKFTLKGMNTIDIDRFESTLSFIPMDSKLAENLFKDFGDKLGVNKQTFLKEVRSKYAGRID